MSPGSIIDRSNNLWLTQQKKKVSWLCKFLKASMWLSASLSEYQPMILVVLYIYISANLIIKLVHLIYVVSMMLVRGEGQFSAVRTGISKKVDSELVQQSAACRWSYHSSVRIRWLLIYRFISFSDRSHPSVHPWHPPTDARAHDKR